MQIRGQHLNLGPCAGPVDLGTTGAPSNTEPVHSDFAWTNWCRPSHPAGYRAVKGHPKTVQTCVSPSGPAFKTLSMLPEEG